MQRCRFLGSPEARRPQRGGRCPPGRRLLGAEGGEGKHPSAGGAPADFFFFFFWGGVGFGFFWVEFFGGFYEVFIFIDSCWGLYAVSIVFFVSEASSLFL